MSATVWLLEKLDHDFSPFAHALEWSPLKDLESVEGKQFKLGLSRLSFVTSSNTYRTVHLYSEFPKRQGKLVHNDHKSVEFFRQVVE